MGLWVRIVLYAPGDSAARTAARAAFARIVLLENKMSDWRPESELRVLERRPGEWQPVSAELFDVLARAVEVARASDGAFDPTVGPLVTLWRQARRTGQLPGRAALDSARRLVGWTSIHLDTLRRRVRLAQSGIRLDLGGIAKGWILQDVLGVLAGAGVRSALVEAGGDLVVGDPPPGRRGWEVDVPGADSGFARRAGTLANAAIATSGAAAQFVEIDGVRYSHVVDPRTGLGLTSPVQAFVIAPHGATADALATASTVADEAQRARLVRRFPGVEVSVRR